MELQTERVSLRPQSYEADGNVWHWHIVYGATEQRIGSIGFFGREPEGALVVGYEIDNEWRGRGLATEALTAMLAHARATGPARRVIADTEPDHLASRRVMEKAGMHIDRVEGAPGRYAFNRPAA